MFVAYKSLILPFAVVEHGNNFSILATIESFFFSLTSVIWYWAMPRDLTKLPEAVLDTQ